MKLAGVTFENRQTVLSIIYNHVPGRTSIVQMYETTYDGKRAVQCIELRSGVCVGWVPASELASHPTFPENMRIRVSMYKGTYYAVIEETKAPTPNMYHTVKKICAATNRPLPPYDEICYRAVLIENRKEKVKVHA
jgi:hypothetical protein